MKTAIKISFASRIFGMVFLLSALVLNQGCKKDKDVAADPAANATFTSEEAARLLNPGKGYNVVNLVSDVEEYSPAHIDPNLVNAWGMAFGPTGGIWVSSTEKGLSTIYDQNGNTLRPPVTMGLGDDASGGEPTGQVFNPTSFFMIPIGGLAGGPVSRFIFATENGTIAAWASGDHAIIVADRSSTGAIYKGLELARDGGSWFLYATDFYNGRIDVFDQNFQLVSDKPFMDPGIPEGYAPFNIRKIGSNLVVTYAKQLAPENKDDERGMGNGFVDIFTTDGQLVRRLASQGMLNSPWGIEMLKTNMGFGSEASGTIGTSDSRLGSGGAVADGEIQTRDGEVEPVNLNPTILIGNFGDGKINAYDSNGKFLGQLMRDGKAIEIEGLWAISYPPQGNPAYREARNRIYFTAGPDDEEHGVFGYLTLSNVK